MPLARTLRWPTVFSFVGLLILGIAGPAAAQTAQPAEPVQADVLLKNGTLFDGTGSPGVVGDIAIRKGEIVAVGTFPLAEAGQVIDCTGLYIAPGFIDLHNHSDSQIVAPLTRGNVNFLLQGCTTIVTGNCGFGPVDAGDYFAKIDQLGAGTHVIHLLPQGSLRSSVMGDDNRAPTPEELAKMRELAEQALRDGVFGMSTGLIYVPGTYARTEELIEIARVIAAYQGLYASHIRGEGLDLLESIQEALEIGRRAGLAVHISHFKASGPRAWGLIRAAAQRIEQARKEGQIVTADQYPYVASSTSLEAMLIPTAARAGGEKALLKRLDNSEQLAGIREYIVRELKERGTQAPIRIARFNPEPKWVGKSLEEIAESAQMTPVEVVLDITRKGGASAVSFGMNEDDVRFGMSLPWVATASDGRAFVPNADRPHPRSFGTFPRKIGYYALHLKTIPVEQAIRSASGLPADILKLTDRGYLKAGLAADVVVFDPKEFRDTATYDDPQQYATGIRYVFVAGQPAVDRGIPTGALAGRALRRPNREARKP